MREKSPYINKDIHVFQMKTADIESVANRQRQRCYAGIPMDEDRNINARMVQRRWCYAGISMNTSITTNVLISQLGTSCAFDSLGLARNEPTPGKRLQGDSTP